MEVYILVCKYNEDIQNSIQFYGFDVGMLTSQGRDQTHVELLQHLTCAPLRIFLQFVLA